MKKKNEKEEQRPSYIWNSGISRLVWIRRVGQAREVELISQAYEADSRVLTPYTLQALAVDILASKTLNST
jgi:hypothetical protein